MSTRIFLLTFGLVTASVALSPARETNRFNLPEKPEKPRFELKDVSWPAAVGEASICLWKDDRLAALSLGVDDNFADEIDFWKDQSTRHDFKVTWFVITGRVVEGGRNPMAGTWAQFRDLKALGHGVESHTVTHLHVLDPGWGTPAWSFAEAAGQKKAVLQNADYATVKENSAREIDAIPHDPAPEWITRGIDWEYARSKADLETGVPGLRAGALAYPGGRATKFNDRRVAAKHYRVARGATGAPNRANMIDYLSTNAMSNWGFGEDPKQHPGANVHNVVDPTLYRGAYYRGWLVLFWHSVTARPEILERTVRFIDQYRDRLWIGLYTDVAKYGQERDTAELTVDQVEPERIRFTLSDEMEDAYFDFPLTVKVRIPDAWKQVTAEQAGRPVEVRRVEHAGAAYVLVQAVPDAGQVTLSPAP